MALAYAMALPQGGRGASPKAIRQIALLAEELGYSHLWVNDHITSPLGQETHISPYMFDPFMTIATAAAMTQEIGIGVQVVAPYYEPLWLANALASLDTLCSGRTVVSLGVGWSKPEFDALSSEFSTRGTRGRGDDRDHPDGLEGRLMFRSRLRTTNCHGQDRAQAGASHSLVGRGHERACLPASRGAR